MNISKFRWAILLAAIIYAIIRYGLVKGEPLANWPAYITNKALAVTAVGWLALGIWARRRDADAARALFRGALLLAATHGFISAALLSPGYYDYLMGAKGRLNAFGEMALLGGGLAIGIFVWLMGRGGGATPDASGDPAQRALSPSRGHLSGLLAILLFHITAVGVLKWIDPARWKFGLVPISLIGALIVAAALTMLWRGGEK